jgi:hypothetical protein
MGVAGQERGPLSGPGPVRCNSFASGGVAVRSPMRSNRWWPQCLDRALRLSSALRRANSLSSLSRRRPLVRFNDVDRRDGVTVRSVPRSPRSLAGRPSTSALSRSACSPHPQRTLPVPGRLAARVLPRLRRRVHQHRVDRALQGDVPVADHLLESFELARMIK